MSLCYRFGPFLLDVEGRRLRQGDSLVRITSKALDLLVLLIQARDRVVSRNEIFDRLWPDVAVEDNNLSQQVHRLRRLLGTDASGTSPIATIPGRGFQFVGLVDEAVPPDRWPALASASGATFRGSQWPASVDGLIGREDDIRRTGQLVMDTHFVTLTGPGGVGKTRLAAAAGWRLRDDLADGAQWIDLTRATRPEDLVPLTAEALGLADAGGRTPILRLRDWLADWDGLLVFDNFEHVLDAAPLLLQLRSPASTVRFLVTSRVPLGVRGEREYAVPPLSWGGEEPEAGTKAIRQSPAVRLFLDRYGAQAGARASDALDVREISALCARLDGLPLAIELAAARARLVPPADLLARDRLATFLPQAPRDVPQRQQSLIGSITWSYDLLDPAAQHGLRALAVFTGGFTPAAGAALLVSAGVVGHEAAAYDVIDRLRQHSLIAFERATAASRMRVLETVREFSCEARTPGEDAHARRMHGEWVRDMFARESAALRSNRHVIAMERLLPDHGNLLAALRWSDEADDVRLLVALSSAASPFWHTANLFREGREWIDHALERVNAAPDIEPETHARLLAGSALMAFHAGAWDDCRTRVDQLGTTDPSGESGVLVMCLDAGLAAYGGDPAGATGKSRLALTAAQALGEPWLEGLAGMFDGFASALTGNHEEAYRRLARTPRDIGFLDLLLDVNLALQALLVGRLGEAARLFEARLHQRYGTYVPVRQIAAAIEGLGYVADRRGRMRRAVLLLAAADRLRRQTAPLSPVWFSEHDRAVGSVRAAFGDRFDVIWAEGASLSLDETLTLASEPVA